MVQPMRASVDPVAGVAGGSRGERKERTRRLILDAALDLCEDSSLVALSLRQVAKEVGIVPTAFYRHFDSIEDLGLALVEESFVSLREMLKDVRRSDPTYRTIIDSSVRVLAEHTAAQHAHFAFIARERVGRAPGGARGDPPPDRARRAGAGDRPRPADRPDQVVHRGPPGALEPDRHLMVGATEAIVNARPDSEPAILEHARTQLRMLLVGALRLAAPAAG